MGFIDFFKKITGKSSKKEAEKIAFDEIENWIGNKEKEIKNKEKEILVLIKNRILEVNNELDEKLIALENVDIESKKVEDKIKLIVRQNLNNYINYTKNFMENINNLKEENLEKLITTVNGIFLNFDKKSCTSYQKATFLIGKEIAAVKGSITNLSRYLEKVFSKNKDIVDSSKIISFVKLKLRQIEEINETINSVDGRIKYLDEKIMKINEVNKKKLEEIEKIKGSKSYSENLKKQKEIKSAEKELEKEFYELKAMIDFKALSNIFHANQEKIGIIKAHKENFQASLYDETNILSLLDEAGLNNETILTKIKQINDKKQEIIKNKEAIKKDETEDLLTEVKKIKLEIESLNNEKDKELKTHNRLKKTREEIIDSIKQELVKINVTVI